LQTFLINLDFSLKFCFFLNDKIYIALKYSTCAYDVTANI